MQLQAGLRLITVLAEVSVFAPEGGWWEGRGWHLAPPGPRPIPLPLMHPHRTELGVNCNTGGPTQAAPWEGELAGIWGSRLDYLSRQLSQKHGILLGAWLNL